MLRTVLIYDHAREIIPHFAGGCLRYYPRAPTELELTRPPYFT
jgi:hypothetical protein